MAEGKRVNKKIYDHARLNPIRGKTPAQIAATFLEGKWLPDSCNIYKTRNGFVWVNAAGKQPTRFELVGEFNEFTRYDYLVSVIARAMQPEAMAA